ncbi:vWA domain-containing protein [Jeotgalibacillus salarius]|uniref:VWA domain-containing protein n=1 Tax=Jeotgalibacillus salarius TaxID=546023 RepID=A0A4Y8LJ14_9BACL|nr:VWA domain-containing protein [Jeotgalibacillus salarius]TFE02381.1 VWA domain-containing protein [Jeotgalibacillus salarius]
MKKRLWFSVLALSLTLAACQDETENETESTMTEEETQTEEVEEVEEVSAEPESVLGELKEMNLPSLPQEPQDFVQQGEGLLNNETVGNGNESQAAFLELFSDVPALPENATQEEMELYYQYIHNITRVSLPDPSDVLDIAQFDMEGMPEADRRYEFKENYNIEIILDASGSMGADAGGETRMEQAKEEIQNFLASAPEEANVSLRVYGHEGTGDDADKDMSCSAIEEVYERGPYDEAAFQEALDQFEPAGWTPVAGALESAAESFEGLDGAQNTNLIYLVSDGIETCDGDPVAAAKSFAGSNISPIINVIGFNADSEAQQQLKEVAKEAGGAYANVNNAEELRNEFEQTKDILKEWEQWRIGALNDRNWTSANATVDINNFSITWNNNARAQVNSEYNAMSLLVDEEKFTYEQLQPMKDLATANYDLALETGSDFYEELQQVKEEGIEGMEQKIEDAKPDGE